MIVGDAELLPHRADVPHGGVIGRREQEDDPRRAEHAPAPAPAASAMSMPERLEHVGRAASAR